MFLMAVWRYSNVFEDHQYWIWLVNYFIHIYIYYIDIIYTHTSYYCYHYNVYIPILIP